MAASWTLAATIASSQDASAASGECLLDLEMRFLCCCEDPQWQPWVDRHGIRAFCWKDGISREACCSDAADVCQAMRPHDPQLQDCTLDEEMRFLCCCEDPHWQPWIDRHGIRAFCWKEGISQEACCSDAADVCRAMRPQDLQLQDQQQDCFANEEHFHFCCCSQPGTAPRSWETVATAISQLRQCFWTGRSPESCCGHLMPQCEVDRDNRSVQVHVSTTKEYWELRYAHGGLSTALIPWDKEDSGDIPGMYGMRTGALKDLLDQMEEVASVIDLGIGDGYQAMLLLKLLPSLREYVGIDLSTTAIGMVQEQIPHVLATNDVFRERSRVPEVSFYAYDGISLPPEVKRGQLDVALSLQVIMHILEPELFVAHLQILFGPESTWRYVVIHADNIEADQQNHIKGWRFTDWVEKHAAEWELLGRYPFTEFAPKELHDRPGDALWVYAHLPRVYSRQDRRAAHDEA